jgi:hypothetical protein
MAYTAKQLIDRFETLKSETTNWREQWQDCADYGMPGNSQITTRRAPGEEQQDSFQTIGENSIIELAAGLYSYMFPTDSKAFILSIDDEELEEVDDIKQALNKVTKDIHKLLIQTNFRHNFFETLKSLCGFGSSCFYEEQGKKDVLNFINFHISTVYIDIDDEGNVDTIFREFEFTPRQAVMKFGKDNISKKIQEAYGDQKRSNEKFKFFHACFPNPNADGKNFDSLTMDYMSYYVCIDDKLIIKQDGYDYGGFPEFPYQFTRFDKDEFEKYGRSPMMKMLPDIKMVAQMRYDRIKGWDKMVDPPAVLPNDGSIWPLSTAPGSVMYKMPGGDDPFWWEFKGNLVGINDAIDRTTQEIKEGATEFIGRLEQKLRKLTPIIGRLQSEMFNPMIKRIVGILGRAGKIPAILEEVSYKIEYLGKIALVLKSLETQGFVITMEQMMPIIEKQGAERDIERIEDNFNFDQIARDISRNNGVPATWLRSEDEKQNIRNQREMLQRAMAVAEALPGLAKATADAGKAPEEGSITEGVMNAA